MPSLHAVISASPLHEASPGRPLPPRRATRAGTPSSSRHHQITASTPAAIRRRFRCRRASLCLTVNSIDCVVSVRTSPTLFPPQCRRGSSTRSISVARHRATVRHCRPLPLRRPLGSCDAVFRSLPRRTPRPAPSRPHTRSNRGLPSSPSPEARALARCPR